MCDCYDYDAPAIYEECERRARKSHWCCECGREIAPTDRYVEFRGLWDGQWSAYRRCRRCHRAAKALYREDCCVAFGKLRECLRERSSWRRTKHWTWGATCDAGGGR